MQDGENSICLSFDVSIEPRTGPDPLDSVFASAVVDASANVVFSVLVSLFLAAVASSKVLHPS
jgi:hypothetical protein